MCFTRLSHCDQRMRVREIGPGSLETWKEQATLPLSRANYELIQPSKPCLNRACKGTILY